MVCFTLTFSTVVAQKCFITVAGESTAAEAGGGGGEDLQSTDDAVVQVADIDMITESRSSSDGPQKGPDTESSNGPSENSRDEEVTSALGIRRGSGGGGPGSGSGLGSERLLANACPDDCLPSAQVRPCNYILTMQLYPFQKYRPSSLA